MKPLTHKINIKSELRTYEIFGVGYLNIMKGLPAVAINLAWIMDDAMFEEYRAIHEKRVRRSRMHMWISVAIMAAAIINAIWVWVGR